MQGFENFRGGDICPPLVARLARQFWCFEYYRYLTLRRSAAAEIMNIERFEPLDQWFPNCGTQRPSRWYANRPTTFS